MKTSKADNDSACSTYRLGVFAAAALFTIASLGCAVPEAPGVAANETKNEIAADAVNINTASTAELERIPYIGPQLAAKIVEHRGRHGHFKKPEHLMLIDGISDKRFRQIRHLIKVE